MKIYENKYVFIETEPSEIPWLKIFTQNSYKEFSQCPHEVKQEIWRLLDIIEKEMIIFFKPTKINIASFGNYVPHVHFHVMARFENDSFFPEPMWGKRQRDGEYILKNMDKFIKKLTNLLE